MLVRVAVIVIMGPQRILSHLVIMPMAGDQYAAVPLSSIPTRAKYIATSNRTDARRSGLVQRGARPQMTLVDSLPLGLVLLTLDGTQGEAGDQAVKKKAVDHGDWDGDDDCSGH